MKKFILSCTFLGISILSGLGCLGYVYMVVTGCSRESSVISAMFTTFILSIVAFVAAYVMSKCE